MSKTIGQRIREIRSKRGITQAELARQIGCAPNTITAWEKDPNRAPGKRLLERVAQILDVSLDALIGMQKIDKPQIPYYGEVWSEEFVWPDTQAPKSFIEVPLSECFPNRFCFKILNDLLEPVVYENDYVLFERTAPQDGDIVAVRFPDKHNKAVIRRWRQKNHTIILLEINPYKICTPYVFEFTKFIESDLSYLVYKEQIVVEGKIIAVKRTKKLVRNYTGINYIFS